MRARVIELPYDKAYIIALGDLHIGDKAFGHESRRKLHGYIKWVEEHENARVILNGDLLNTATRDSKTSPFEQDLTLEEQIREVVGYLTPIKNKIIGAVMGNHERRILDHAGFDPTTAVLFGLGLKLEDVYFKHCGVLNIKVGQRKDRGKLTNRIQYTVVFHHTTGGGKLIGSKLNRVDQMTHSTVANADVYIGSHNHSLSCAIKLVNEYSTHHNKIIERKQLLVNAGGYLEWNGSYAEQMQLEPMKIGSPRIRLSGLEKDAHCSL